MTFSIKAGTEHFILPYNFSINCDPPPKKWFTKNLHNAPWPTTTTAPEDPKRPSLKKKTMDDRIQTRIEICSTAISC